MIIIFEGVDNSGKTTIAKELSRITGIPYFKHKHQQRDVFTIDRIRVKYEAELFIDLMSQLKLDLIVDRHIPSEYAYSIALDRSFLEKAVWKIDKELAELGAILIYCEKTADTEFNDVVINPDQRQLIINAYHAYLEMTDMRFLFLDTTDENIDDQMIQIQNFMEDCYD